jgi:hypothetical protein
MQLKYQVTPLLKLPLTTCHPLQWKTFFESLFRVVTMLSFQDTIKQLDSLQPHQFATDAERFEAKEAARRLLNRLETPFEQGWRLSFETPVLIAGVQMIVDLGIWKKWTEANKRNPDAAVALDQLLAWANPKAEPNLLRKSNRFGHGRISHCTLISELIRGCRPISSSSRRSLCPRRDGRRYLEANTLLPFSRRRRLPHRSDHAMRVCPKPHSSIPAIN